jgi:hypothetical protein
MKGMPYSHDFVEGVMGGVMDSGDFKRRSMAGGSGQYDGEGMSGGFGWGDVWNGIKKVGRMAVAPVGNALGATVGMPMAGTIANGALGLAGLGKKKHTLQDHLEHPNKGFGRSGGRKPSDALQRRAKLISKLRQDKGMTMIEASKYIKANGLKY